MDRSSNSFLEIESETPNLKILELKTLNIKKKKFLPFCRLVKN